MAKLRIFKPSKTKDYRFLDKLISSQFNISGTVIHCHKYLDPIAQTNSNDTTLSSSANSPLTIEDILLIENRDRNYDPNIIDLTAAYIVNDLDYNLSQFGIMVNSSVLFLNFHINDMIDRLGRKLIPGDVIEIFHRKDEVPLDSTIPYIPAYYVVKDTAKAADGYSATWWPHILRVRAEPMPTSQEYAQILDQPVKKGLTLQDLISTANTIQNNNDAVVAQGDANVPTKNFNSDNLYIAGQGGQQPGDNLIQWPFNNAGYIPNTNTLAPSGTRFPDNPMPGDWFLRTDYQPSRLFQREDTRWCAQQNVYRDRVWTAANRTLEDFLDPTQITTMSNQPADTFTEREPMSDPIPNKDHNLD